MFVIIVILVLLGIYWWMDYNGGRHIYAENLKWLPMVSGALPFVGHGIAFSRNNIQFIRQAKEKYGDFFKIKIFNKTIGVCTDHSLKQKFFDFKEDQMSLYEVLEGLYFGEAFSDDPNSLKRIIKIVKTTIKIRFDEFAPKIFSEAANMVDLLKNSVNKKKPLDLREIMMRFVVATSAKCFLGITLDKEFYDTLIKFTNLTNKIVVLTYFIPMPIIRFVFNPILKRYRSIMITKMEPIIKEYRLDITKDESYILRKCVDYEKDCLSNKQIGEIVICLLYISSENTALGSTATAIDLIQNPIYWDRLKKEIADPVKNSDYNALFDNALLNSCVMESARTNTHIFPLVRKPESVTMIGNFYVGDVDCVALCEPVMMLYDSPTFANPLSYNPYRYLDPNNEPSMPKDVMTWGAGKHLCPGKMFAIYEIKAAVAFLINNFDRPTITKLSALNYFSPAAFAERDCQVIFN